MFGLIWVQVGWLEGRIRVGAFGYLHLALLIARPPQVMPLNGKVRAIVGSLDVVLVLLCVCSGVGTARGWAAPALVGAGLFLAGALARCSKTLKSNG